MKIALLGDVALFGRFDLTKNTEIFSYLRTMKEYLSRFDRVIVNLETPFSRNGKTHGAKSAYIKSPPENVDVLKFLGITNVGLANNHVFDFGQRGLAETVCVLEENGLDYFGIDGRVNIIESSCAKLAFHGYCSYNTNPMGMRSGRGTGVNILNAEDIIDQFEKYHELGCLNVLSSHSGVEHVNYPSLDDIDLARRISDRFHYVYCGHHPHVLQGIEEFNDSVIAYSLGNFCFDDVYTSKSDTPLVKMTKNNKTGGILEIEVSGNRVTNYHLTPYYLGSKSFEFIPKDKQDFLKNYSKALRWDADVYASMRNELIQRYIAKRKSTRDIDWYIKRLRPSSLELILRAQYNKIMYRRSMRGRLVK